MYRWTPENRRLLLDRWLPYESGIPAADDMPVDGNSPIEVEEPLEDGLPIDGWQPVDTQYLANYENNWTKHRTPV